MTPKRGVRGTALLAAALACAAPAALPAQEPAAGETHPPLITFSNIDKAWRHTTGEGVKVAVIDWQFDLSAKAADKYVHPSSVVADEKIGEAPPWHGEWMAEIVHRVAPGAKIIPINARSRKHRDYQQYLVAAIRLAADHGAVAVTSSMGPAMQSTELREAIDYAEQRGTIFVNVHPEMVAGSTPPQRGCALGECDARIVRAGIVAVEAYPAKPLETRDVYTWPYMPEPKYKDGWGYSIAPPTIGGTIALMKSANRALTPGQIRELLRTTAANRDGFRALDAEAAVKAALALRSHKTEGAAAHPGASVDREDLTRDVSRARGHEKRNGVGDL